MIYLIHPSGVIACCEAEASAAPYAAQGYRRCSRDAFVAAWRDRDLRRMDELGLLGPRVEAPTETAPLKRAGTIRTRLAEWTHYDAQGRKVE